MSVDNYLVVGKFGKTYGAKGWLKVTSYCQPNVAILTYDKWYIKKNGFWQELALQDTNKMNDKVAVLVAGCTTPEEARLYTNLEIAINKNQLKKISENEHYWINLKGMQVVNYNGEELGILEYLFTAGNNDVMMVKGEKKHLIPFIKSIIINVNYEDNKIIVDWDTNF